jgi:hypothetical protein
MRRSRALISRVLLAVLLVSALHGQKRPPAEVPDGLKQELTGYLHAQGTAPEDYVAAKFKDHDIVFIGEHHFIKHDVEFVRSLIPVLYRIGVRDLGIEFGCYELQREADALVTAETYDEARARRLMFQWASYWPYVEYLALYRAAWELNRTLPRDAPKFRIVGLDYRARWDRLEEKMTRRLWGMVFFEGPRDRHMANVIMHEFVKNGRKALVYAGQFHASTRFAWPDYDFVKKRVTNFHAETMGQLVRRNIRGRAFNICLHYPWETIEGPKSFDYPVGGAVDRVMRGSDMKRMGFDVVGSPFGRLPDPKAVYAQGRKRFVFGDFCDGYVFLGPFAECEGCDVDPLFITDENLAEAVAYLPNASLKKKIVNRLQFLNKMKWDADFRRLYPDLE